MNKTTPLTTEHSSPFHDALTEVLQIGARQLLQQAIEAELHDFMSTFSNCYTTEGKALVVRNGYQPERAIMTGIGAVSARVPKVRSRGDDSVVFHSSIVPPYIRRSQRLDATLPWLYLKGISSGQMQSALSALLGEQAKGLSPAVVGRLKQQWLSDYQDWCRRDLSQQRWVYLWVDGIYSGLRGEDGKLCALVIIGVDGTGTKQLLAIEDGVRESTQSWREVLLDIKRRGVESFELAIGDGAMGFWAALEEIYPKAKQQRCWVHKTANILNKLPKGIQPKAKAALHDIWMAETEKEANQAYDHWLTTYQDKYPKAAECLLKDRDTLLTFYQFPAVHWQHIRTTNPIESAFATIRHRSKQSKGCLNRNGMLSMIFKLGRCAEENWRRLRGFKQLEKVINGVQFKDGIEVNNQQQKHVA